MKKLIIPVIISLLAIAIAIHLDFLEKENNTTEEISSYGSGYEEGLSIGKEIGYENGYDEGYSVGHEDGYGQGYSDGESDGYYSGATYTCLFYGDVDKAFKSAKNGAAWYTFVDAYDKYIANIYDDDEKRLNIIWALISATIGEDATADEIELLKASFDEELFSNNGIKLSP